MIENLEELERQLKEEADKIRGDVCIKDSLCIKNSIWDLEQMLEDIKARIILDYIEKLLYKIDEK